MFNQTLTHPLTPCGDLVLGFCKEVLLAKGGVSSHHHQQQQQRHQEEHEGRHVQAFQSHQGTFAILATSRSHWCHCHVLYWAGQQAGGGVSMFVGGLTAAHSAAAASAAICRICPAAAGLQLHHHPMRQVQTCPDDDLAALARQIDQERCWRNSQLSQH